MTLPHEPRPPRALRRRGRSGNYAVIFGLSMVSILGFAALAVDVSYIRISALQAQNAADAGAHAAMIAYRALQTESDAATVAIEVAGMNVVAGGAVTVDPGDVVFGGWDYNDSNPTFDPGAPYVNAAQVTVRRTDASADGPLQLLLAPIFGHNSANIVAVATSALRFREVMIALDITGSFKDEFEQARQALLTFLDGLWRGGAAYPGDRIGLVTYVGDAAIHTNLSYVDADYNFIEDDWSNVLSWCNHNYVPWDSLYGGAYYNDAPDMIDCAYPEDPSVIWQPSGANPGAGIEEAADELLALGDPTALKYIILVSDGGADCPNPHFAQGGSCTALQRRVNGIQQANLADASNISIHTVYLDNVGTAVDAAYIANLTRGYGQSYSTVDATDLPAYMEELVELIPVALVH